MSQICYRRQRAPFPPMGYETKGELLGVYVRPASEPVGKAWLIAGNGAKVANAPRVRGMSPHSPQVAGFRCPVTIIIESGYRGAWL